MIRYHGRGFDMNLQIPYTLHLNWFFMVYNSQSGPGRKEGLVLEALPGLTFKVRLEKEQEILGYLAGKLKLHHIRVLPGDRVLVEMSPDGRRGRIVRRL